MNKTLIKKNYSEIIGKLKKYNQAYYEKDSPIISDQQYDILKKKIIDKEVATRSSAKEQVGADQIAKRASGSRKN